MKRKKLLAVPLSAAMLLSGCGGSAIQANNLMQGVQAQEVSVEGTVGSMEKVDSFAVRLLQQSDEAGGNTLLSPLSVLCALAMTAGGAKGETRAQMEEAFGMTAEELGQNLHACISSLPNEDGCRVHLADSIWLKEDDKFSVEQDFLQQNANWYGAGVYQAPFDEATKNDINAWVRENTDGMIDNILDEIPKEAAAYLVNALAFDVKWENEYKAYQVEDGTFTADDGTQKTVQMMHSTEETYLEDENSCGVMKRYQGGKYDFVALLPEEGMPLSDYVASLSGDKLADLLDGAQSVDVETQIPKFRMEYSTELSGALRQMGITDAFDKKTADFSGIGTYPEEKIYLSRVLHKTYAEVSETGTKAAAATVVEAATASTAAPEPEEKKTVTLDRPFVYLIVDHATNFPIFLGTIATIGE